MAKFLLVAVVVLALLQIGLALKCNQCTDVKCDKVKEEECHPPSGQEASCLTEIYKDKTETWTVKKCVNSDAGKTYSCIKQPGTEQIKCDTCKMDLCNAANGLQMGPVIFVALATAYFVPRFI